jgi:hypothetical protein
LEGGIIHFDSREFVESFEEADNLSRPILPIVVLIEKEEELRKFVSLSFIHFSNRPGEGFQISGSHHPPSHPVRTLAGPVSHVVNNGYLVVAGFQEKIPIEKVKVVSKEVSNVVARREVESHHALEGCIQLLLSVDLTGAKSIVDGNPD